MAESKIVKNNSKAYGYDYASLGDIVKQGFEIPKMRLAIHDGVDYIEYFDGAEWQLGSQVVIPEMKGSNSAQAYGAAITYARRYTALLALALASDDDTKVETDAPNESNQKPKKTFDLKEADKRIKDAKSEVEVRKIYAEAPVGLRKYLQKGCEARIKELKNE